MAVSLMITTPSSGYSTHVDAVVNSIYSYSLIQLRELVDVEMMLRTLGVAATDAQIADNLANVGTWPAYANAAAREAAVNARRSTLNSLRI